MKRENFCCHRIRAIKDDLTCIERYNTYLFSFISIYSTSGLIFHLKAKRTRMIIGQDFILRFGLQLRVRILKGTNRDMPSQNNFLVFGASFVYAR